MANEMNTDIDNFSPKGTRKEGRPLPTWEFFYTGTIWRLTRGLKGKNLNGFFPTGII